MAEIYECPETHKNLDRNSVSQISGKALLINELFSLHIAKNFYLHIYKNFLLFYKGKSISR